MRKMAYARFLAKALSARLRLLAEGKITPISFNTFILKYSLSKHNDSFFLVRKAEQRTLVEIGA